MDLTRKKTILVAVDFSHATERTLQTGLALAQSWNMELALCHVCRPVAVTPATSLLPLSDEFVMQEEAHRSLVKLVAQAQQHGVSAKPHVRVGDPSLAILELAHELHAVAIVLGSHGNGGLMHKLLGSVPTKVARESTVPVIVVPPNLSATWTLATRGAETSTATLATKNDKESRQWANGPR